MLPKKNIGAITVMSAFLGLTLTHILTAFIYYTYSKGGDAAAANHIFSGLVKGVELFELLFILAISVGAALLFVNSDDYHSMSLLGASSVLTIMTMAVKFPSVRDSENVMVGAAFLLNLSILAIFAIYAIFYSRREMKQSAMIIWIAGIWVSFVSVGCGAVAARFIEGKTIFLIRAVIALISAVCYFIAYYSQRQSFE